MPWFMVFVRGARWTGWLLASVLLLGAGVVRAAESMPSFAEWRAACSRLPLNRSLNGRLPPRDLLPLQTFTPLGHVLKDYFAMVSGGPLADTALWVGSAPNPATYFNVSQHGIPSPTSQRPFDPYARKLVLPAGTEVVLQADLHGDIHSLLAVLARWQELGWLEDFRLTGTNRHVVYLGDYTDRGLYGVEVLYTLLRLKLANPDRVHLVRGNHEDLSLVARYGFMAEGMAKYGEHFDAAQILRAYDFLPVVTYLGCGTNFVQLCHGGMEPGYDPSTLLGSTGTNRYQLIGPLRQARFLASHPNWLQNEPTARADAKRVFEDFTPTSPTTPTVLGFMWNDFTVFEDEPGFAINPERAFVYGRPAVASLLEMAGGTGARVHAVIRGHQHSGVPNPLMRRLVAGRGVYRHWQEKQTSAALLAKPADLAATLGVSGPQPLPEGSVWTFNVVPDSVYGAGCHFDFATFGVLRLDAAFADWRISAEPVKVEGLQRME